MDAGLDERTLRRIIAMLVALAVLAERAAYRSFPVRWLVLSLLRHAEAVARDHIADATGWDWPDLEQVFGIDGIGAGFDTGQGAGSGPADALALGWRLRALAALLHAFLPPDDLFGSGDTSDGTVAARHRDASHVARFIAEARDGTHPAPDTS